MLLRDVRYAVRSLLKAPAFTLTALAALALGIGSNTAIFSVVDAVLLRPFTFPDPDRIVGFAITSPTGVTGGGSATRFNVWRSRTDLFSDISAYEYQGTGMNLTGGAFPEQVHVIRVTADYFRLFGAPVVRGRTFTADEDRPGGGRVAVLSYRLAQRISGSTILLNGEPYSIAGVIGPEFRTELDTPPDVWLPFQIDPNSQDHAQYFAVVARLRPGITLAQANSRLEIAGEEFRRKFPSFMGARERFVVERFKDSIVAEVRPSLLILTGAVGFVLLIACANVASLSLVRATGRTREIAVRAALGACRGHIIRQLLTESLLLSLVGGVCGLALGTVGVRALLAMKPGDIPRLGGHGTEIGLDWRILVFALAVSVVTGILFGVAPAVGVSGVDLGTALKESSGRAGTGRRQNRTRAFLVMGEVALAIVLLIGAGLLIRSFIALRSVDPGFDASNILTMRMSLSGSQFEKTAEVTQLIRDASRRIDALPGAVAAAASYMLPLEGAFGIPFNIVGRSPANGRYDGRGWNAVSPEYFSVYRIPLLRGRVFTERDGQGSGGVAVINQTLARQFWPHEDPIGSEILLGKGYGPEFEEAARQIVGVVADVRDFGLNSKPTPVVYVPMAQVTDGITALASRASSIAWMIRTRSGPAQMSVPIEKQLEQAANGLPVTKVRTMEQVVARSTGSADFNMTLLTIFGCSALLLAAVGIYGLMAYSVEQRTQEIGVRLALGAGAGQVQAMVMFEGMRLALMGAAAGVAAAFLMTRLMASFLFGVAARDLVVFITVPVVLSLAAFLAVWIPARRAAQTNPLDALRHG